MANEEDQNWPEKSYQIRDAIRDCAAWDNKPKHWVVMMAVASRINYHPEYDGWCAYPGKRQLAHDTPYKQRAVQDALDELETEGWIWRRPRRDTSDLIFFDLKKLWNALQDERKKEAEEEGRWLKEQAIKGLVTAPPPSAAPKDPPAFDKALVDEVPSTDEHAARSAAPASAPAPWPVKRVVTFGDGTTMSNEGDVASLVAASAGGPA